MEQQIENPLAIGILDVPLVAEPRYARNHGCYVRFPHVRIICSGTHGGSDWDGEQAIPPEVVQEVWGPAYSYCPRFMFVLESRITFWLFIPGESTAKRVLVIRRPRVELVPSRLDLYTYYLLFAFYDIFQSPQSERGRSSTTHNPDSYNNSIWSTSPVLCPIIDSRISWGETARGSLRAIKLDLETVVWEVGGALIKSRVFTWVIVNSLRLGVMTKACHINKYNWKRNRCWRSSGEHSNREYNVAVHHEPDFENLEDDTGWDRWDSSTKTLGRREKLWTLQLVLTNKIHAHAGNYEDAMTQKLWCYHPVECDCSQMCGFDLAKDQDVIE